MPSGGRNLAIFLGAGTLALAGVVAAVVVLATRQDPAAPAPAAASAAPTDQSGTADTGSADTSASTSAAAVAATVPGWQGVTAGGADIDVPASWTTGSAAGSAEPGAAAIAGQGVCGASGFRAIVKSQTDPSADAATGANNILQQFMREVDFAGNSPQVAMAPPAPTVGGYQDYKATVTLIPPTGQTCTPPEAIVHVVVKSDGGGTSGVLIEGDQQCDRAVAEADLDKIASTVRPASEVEHR